MVELVQTYPIREEMRLERLFLSSGLSVPRITDTACNAFLYTLENKVFFQSKDALVSDVCHKLLANVADGFTRSLLPIYFRSYLDKSIKAEIGTLSCFCFAQRSTVTDFSLEGRNSLGVPLSAL